MATPTSLPSTFVAGNVLTAAQMNDLRGAFRVLQVLQTVKTDTFTTSSTAFTTVTGLSQAITPSSTSSKILIIAQVSVTLASSGNWGGYKVTRGGTDIYRGDAAGSRPQVVFGGYSLSNNSNDILSNSIVYLDSPATTSSTTYRVEAIAPGGTAIYVNRSTLDGNDGNSMRAASSITVMEISA